MPRGTADGAIERAHANALRTAEVIDAEIIDDEPPPRGELILLGRASLADLTRNPDAWDEAELDRDLADAEPENSKATFAYQWGRWLWWTGKTSREYLPGHPVSLRAYIKAHLTMRRDPKQPGVPLPYAYATVENAVYIISSIHQRFGYLSPVTKKVTEQLDWYKDQCRKRRMKPRKASALTPTESVRIARACDPRTISGLRNATAFRLQFSTGSRAREMLAITFADVTWIGPDRVRLYIAWSKTKQPRVVYLQARTGGKNPDVDPLVLFRTWYELMRDRGHITPDSTVFRMVNSARPRKDGRVSGNVRDEAWDYGDYELEFVKAARRAGVDSEPVSGEKRIVTSHSNRAGYITAARNARIPVEAVAAVTGHSPTSRVIHDYYRSAAAWDEANPGWVIREQEEEQQ